jgi:hypothetical protein
MKLLPFKEPQLTWDELFNICKTYRTTTKIPPDEVVISYLVIN